MANIIFRYEVELLIQANHKKIKLKRSKSERALFYFFGEKLSCPLIKKIVEAGYWVDYDDSGNYNISPTPDKIYKYCHKVIPEPLTIFEKKKKILIKKHPSLTHLIMLFIKYGERFKFPSWQYYQTLDIIKTIDIGEITYLYIWNKKNRATLAEAIRKKEPLSLETGLILLNYLVSKIQDDFSQGVIV